MTNWWWLSRWFPADSRQKAFLIAYYTLSLGVAVCVIPVLGVMFGLPLATLALLLSVGPVFWVQVTGYWHAILMGRYDLAIVTLLIGWLLMLPLWSLALWPW